METKTHWAAFETTADSSDVFPYRGVSFPALLLLDRGVEASSCHDGPFHS